MSFLSFFRSIFTSDEALLTAHGARSVAANATLNIPQQLDCPSILAALHQYGREAGYSLMEGVERHKGNVLMDSIKHQAVNLHEEIIKYYKKADQTADEKRLNLLTVVNIFYLSMGSALLAKVKRSDLIAKGVFKHLMQKSGPEVFYREVAAMAGNKYGAEEVEALHQHVQRAAFLLLSECDKRPDRHTCVMECARAMYMYGLMISLK
ncbi:MAG: hypothetical protein K6E86_00505 [Bacteroidales bacterium]|nr:hypothetical protein [Bacteroidales bacterium]